MMSNERQLDQAAYRRMKPQIAQQYPRGHFVAIFGGAIVADAADFLQLESLLRSRGIPPGQALVVEAGVDYPENAIILHPIHPIPASISCFRPFVLS